MWQLHFLGATGTVTGSKYLLESKSQRILIDCSLFQGYKLLRLRNWHALPFNPAQLDSVILTHAHIDHSGYLPLLVKHGFTGPIYCTHATRDLCEILLPDSGRLQEEEAEYANHHRFSKHKPALPLYTEEDARRCLKLFNIVNTVEESERLNRRRKPMIILAGSGMATGGRVIHHLKAFAPDARYTILFSGFQAGGTRGAAMIDGAKEIKIHGEYVPIRAEVAVIDNLSAHADANEILQWLKSISHAPKRIFITHGEPTAADTLRLRIQDELGWSAYVPDYLETISLN